MAKPLPVTDPLRTGSNGVHGSKTAPLPVNGAKAPVHVDRCAADVQSEPATDDLQEVEGLRHDNAQLRALCLELEQALQEAAVPQDAAPPAGSPAGVYEAVIEEKSETIRQLHQQIQELQAALADAEAQTAAAVQQAQANPHRSYKGPAPREEELLALSEELERERRQLQEDEQTLMEQMREMEVSMAKERAEVARQRNDLQRLQAEIRHELERLERSGTLQSKIDNLKNKLQDATARRGASRGDTLPGQKLNAPVSPSTAAPPASSANKGAGFMGRFFGQGGR